MFGSSYEVAFLLLQEKANYARGQFTKDDLKNINKYYTVMEAMSVAHTMLRKAQSVVQIDDGAVRSIDMKIGISFGKAVGSLVGNKICRFDIFGEAPLSACKAMYYAPLNRITLNNSAHSIYEQGRDLTLQYIKKVVHKKVLREELKQFNRDYPELSFKEANSVFIVDLPV